MYAFKFPTKAYAKGQFSYQPFLSHPTSKNCTATTNKQTWAIKICNCANTCDQLF